MSNTVNVNDVFWTFQGEGTHAGRRALFIRLPFCNLSCSWCDTEFNSFYSISLDQLKEIALSEKARFAVITGGEPTMNKHFLAIHKMLIENDFSVAVESNGTFPAPEGDYWLTVSPKREQKAHEPYYIDPVTMQRASEFKYVVDKDFDFSVLERHKFQLTPKFLSPEFNQFSENLEKIYSYIKENPEWKISLQTHKWMGVK